MSALDYAKARQNGWNGTTSTVGGKQVHGASDYLPDKSSSGAGSSSSSSSGRGSSSGSSYGGISYDDKYGYAYDKNEDYQALIDKAVAAGDYYSAARYEQKRNQKIQQEGITDYKPTYNYAQYLDKNTSSGYKEFGDDGSYRFDAGTGYQVVGGGYPDIQARIDEILNSPKNYINGDKSQGFVPGAREELARLETVRNEKIDRLGLNEQKTYTYITGTVYDRDNPYGVYGESNFTSGRMADGTRYKINKTTGEKWVWDPSLDANGLSVGYVYAGTGTPWSGDREPINTESGGGSGGGGGGGGSSSGGGSSGGNRNDSYLDGMDDMSDYPSITLPTPEDQSETLKKMYEEYINAQLADLKNDYELNQSVIDATASKVPLQYQNARNQTASSYEQQRRAFAEQANAAGLSSGAGAQAALSMGNAYQGNLTNLNRGEADTLADLELQRTQLTTAYNNAITKAKAAGNFELAEKLYQEGVRMDEALLNQSMAQAELDWKKWYAEYQKRQDAIDNQYRENVFQHQVSQDQIANEHWDLEFEYGKEQDAIDNQHREDLFDYQQKQDAANSAYKQLLQEYEQQQEAEKMRLQMAQLAAKYGDYSQLEQLGVDTSWYQQQQTQDAIQSAVETAVSNAKGGGSNAPGASSGSAPDVVTPNLQKDTTHAPEESESGEGLNWDNIDMNSVLALGYGPISRAKLEQLVESGEITAYMEGGKIKFRKNSTNTGLGGLLGR